MSTNAMASQINAEVELAYNIHLVTCWMCWKIFPHKPCENELTCPHCNFNEDACHFPDLFY